jgi:hypothetical protein
MRRVQQGSATPWDRIHGFYPGCMATKYYNQLPGRPGQDRRSSYPRLWHQSGCLLDSTRQEHGFAGAAPERTSDRCSPWSLTRKLSRLPKKLRRSFTYDNGSENVERLAVNKVLKDKSYFTEPCRRWGKPTVENTAGLIRRVFPNKTRFDKIPVQAIKAVERSLNNRLRKCLSFRIPREVFHQLVALAH